MRYSGAQQIDPPAFKKVWIGDHIGELRLAD